MRKLFALVIAAVAAIATAPAFAADPPEYIPPYTPPPVDYGLEGSFYLRGSAAVNLLWTREHAYDCVPCTINYATDFGYGFSLGAGIGYETGDGLRYDLTGDYIYNYGLTNGDYTLEFRGGLALANVYYDFGFGGGGWGAEGGFGAYVGAGIGAAAYTTVVTGPVAVPDGYGVTAAAAGMVGVTYDMGSLVADMGYRMVYLPTITNGANDTTPFYLNDNFIHELRGTLRYRFN